MEGSSKQGGLKGTRRVCEDCRGNVSNVFFVVEPSEIIFLYRIRYPKEDIILLYIGHHSIPK